MTTIQVQATLSPQELLKATQQLDTDELKELIQQLSALYAKRQMPHLSEKEATLLRKINQGIPLALWQPYKIVAAKRDAESLTPAEHAELIRLSDEIERLHAERVKYLVELAQLRNVPLSDLMDDLGIHPLNHA
ncbi:MAG TPA: STAS/SEC14 domain-containing protein [Chloroflexota bacterium]|nr:STAS/SEC14 domain-containing protein [Chloroflexota bacterium]HUM72143.1 STAS/SEC14 domain-containing protein [Chloroflexota bacterium]